MNKIPVGQTIAETYGFAFGRYFSLLGVTWLPLLLLAVCFGLAVAPLFQELADIAKHANEKGFEPDLGAMRFIYVWQLAFYLVSVVLSVGVAKVALGLRRGPRFVYFVFGRDELRILGGKLLILGCTYGYFIVVLGLIVICGLATAAGLSASEGPNIFSGPHNGYVFASIMALGAIFLAGLFYLQIRLGFLLVPITISEHRFGIRRNWELTRGNVWRIIGIQIVATAIPLLVLEIVALAVLVVPILAMASGLAGHAHSTNISPQELLKMFGGFALLIPLVGLLIAPLACGFVLGPAAFAYRALMPESQGEGATATS